MVEGRGFLIRHAPDGPWAGWVGSRFLEEGLASKHAAPGRALHRLMGALAPCPGGFALVWDHAPSWMAALHTEERGGWWEALSAIPGLTLHVRPEAAEGIPGGAFRAWLHQPEVPRGPVGEAWRSGFLGWVPGSGTEWSLPGLARLRPGRGEEAGAGWIWGEAVVPLGALQGLLDSGDLGRALGDLQGRLEQAMALRLNAGAWPELPFLRRSVGWRLALCGGAEFQRASGDFEKAATQVAELKARLTQHLRAPIHLGAGEDLAACAVLGQQAMREGLPWRSSLPLPPTPSSFTPGLSGDPRTVQPLTTRAALPGPLATLLDHAPTALLRVPAVPSEGAVAHLLKSTAPGLALRFLTPDLIPPGPFDPDHPWPAAAEFPPPLDPKAGVQQTLFDLG